MLSNFFNIPLHENMKEIYLKQPYIFLWDLKIASKLFCIHFIELNYCTQRKDKKQNSEINL